MSQPKDLGIQSYDEDMDADTCDEDITLNNTTLSKDLSHKLRLGNYLRSKKGSSKSASVSITGFSYLREVGQSDNINKSILDSIVD